MLSSPPDLTSLQKKVLLGLQDGIPLTERPFKDLAEKSGLSEEVFLSCVRDLYEKGYIRRLGATLQHQVSGYAANVMVAWRVPAKDVERVGEIMKLFRPVTHCYERRTVPDWPYNLYTMVHAGTEAACHSLVMEISAKTGISDYQLLFSEKELKRSNIQYFKEE